MNALDVMKYGNLTVLKSIDGLGEADWNTAGVCGWWSVREIIAHLASFERVLVDVLNTALGEEAGPDLKAMAEQRGRFNDVQVERRKDYTVQQVLAEYNNAHARAMEVAAKIPAEKFRESGILPWYGAEYDLDDYIAYAFYGHKREHTAQIAVFRDTLKG
jgi:uncharacterized protein (TIGR03083 family)